MNDLAGQSSPQLPQASIDTSFLDDLLWGVSMGDEKTENPRDAVFTTALWDGGFALADWELHLQRLGEHAKLLRIELIGANRQLR